MDGGMKICGNCGARIPEGAAICSVCGCPADAQADFGEFNAFVNGNTEVNESAIDGHTEWGSAAVVRAGSVQREEPKPASAPVSQPGAAAGPVYREEPKLVSAPVQQPSAGINNANAGGADSKQNKQVSPVVGMMFGRAGQQIYNQHNNANAGGKKPADAATDNTANDGKTGLKRNKWVAFCLALFLGVIGAHKFYEHKYGKGILYIMGAMIASSIDPSYVDTNYIVFGQICTLVLACAILRDVYVIFRRPNPYYI